LGIMNLTQKNAVICPGVAQIMEKLERIYNWTPFDLKFTAKIDKFVIQSIHVYGSSRIFRNW
jgi:hypothetical protein